MWSERNVSSRNYTPDKRFALISIGLSLQKDLAQCRLDEQGRFVLKILDKMQKGRFFLIMVLFVFLRGQC